MSFGVLITVFALIVPAELPDKTFIATLVLSTRFRAWAVWSGVAAAFAVQSGVAVAAGGLVSLLPKQPVRAVTAALFAVGSVILLVSRESIAEEVAEEEREVAKEIATAPAAPTFRRAVLTSFGVLFAAEWGDISQVLTASFAAKYGDPTAVFLGSWLALVGVAALAIAAGRVLLRVVPLLWIRRLAGVLFGALAIVTALEAADVL